MRIAAISVRNTHRSLAESSALVDHRSTKIITSDNTRPAIYFNPITPKQARSKD